MTVNSNQILGLVGGGGNNYMKLKTYSVKTLRSYAKKLKIKITKNQKYLSKDELLKKIKNN